MFYKMISAARDRWLASPECTVRDRIAYMEQAGQLRDVQIDAIKTYLYLKIVCRSKPLHTLFSEGAFNCLDLDTIPLSAHARTWLLEHPDAAALLQYAMLLEDPEQKKPQQLAEQLRTHPEEIDCQRFFKDIFYGVSYTDYLFSLPMGAGKTYLMAAFIYLDLYYASREPNNPVFAHNFMIFVPSGLKSSVIPSLKTIQDFNPAWVLPEPAASELKRRLHYEFLEEQKTGAKDNKISNPNAGKIVNYLGRDNLLGLVAVTNAEKVILDRLPDDSAKGGQVQMNLPPQTEDERDRQANELRNLIGKLPALSVFIDEVHHAVSSKDKKQERKLRGVVNSWAAKGSVVSVIGFTGTPYLEKKEKVRISGDLDFSTAEITNTVYYYPLVEGVGNFLKRPVLKIADIADSARIVQNGVRAFLDTYKDTVYQDGTAAKLGIYCANIEKLEEQIFPLVQEIVREYGLREDAVLKFHRGNQDHPIGAENQMLYNTLDQPESKVRIVLLVQIGREGWDCRSLTGIILSQEGDCPRNTVLQTACRCLRQVDRGMEETALIYLNRANAEIMRVQLQKQHHISLNEFSAGRRPCVPLKRYDRTETLRLPSLPFYQLRVHIETSVVETAHPSTAIPEAASRTYLADKTHDADFTTFQTLSTHMKESTGNTRAVFFPWLCRIAKGSFGTLSVEQLEEHQAALQTIFDKITFEKDDGARYFNNLYDRAAVEANIRKAFADRREFEMKEEVVREDARLLVVEKFKTEIPVPNPTEYYPDQKTAAKIVEQDGRDEEYYQRRRALLELAAAQGLGDLVAGLEERPAHPGQNRSFHYLPYHLDSGLEREFLAGILPLDDLESLGLEVYYNGDSSLTEFQLDCYKHGPYGWRFVGRYTPDFLIFQRRGGEIEKVLIVETKGRLYANDPAFQDRRLFAETEFLEQNERFFGYRRFEYLYIEGSLAENEARIMTKIRGFFEE